MTDLAAFGATRSDIKARHALLTPESHEWITQPDWPGAEMAWLISPDLGAGLAMGLVRCPDACDAAPASDGIARFVFCLEGALHLTDGTVLEPEGFAFQPAGTGSGLHLPAGARAVVFEWRFMARGSLPDALSGRVQDIAGRALRGDDRLIVQKMLPEDVRFDFEFNIMSFDPGASLAYVETHFMEHGLLMLDGGGVYRLDRDWYPVTAGDAIWMGPHVPQWFGALGRGPSRYLICKNYNRSPMSPR
ncbi:(S)-ureidoglycine aminohydrolase [Paracoccus laeviglucosivorans]|uniref:(S)-ureidoglycine aminohydrolase n=1 Tax=Paracoccus laeviglucosivorans TaxID=1197861 RepID=A0A521FNG6_9RHOB|nr:(S)-ureidoglycine aminohydrolase [Paracoccus laeviglucosivorans]SMO97737.1 (S)-ureidoglycine aminohydrolase [Paracoccus laeviglucosivorans]